jgi:hypothetical protein
LQYLPLNSHKGNLKTIVELKGQSHKIFCFRFFHESHSPKPLKITLGSFRIFSKIRGDIRNLRCTTGVNNTGDKFATGVNDTGGKIAAGINDTPAANLPPVAICHLH